TYVESAWRCGSIGDAKARKNERRPLVPLVETGRVIPEKLAPRGWFDTRPAQDVVHGVGELAFGVRVVGPVHQRIVPEAARDVVEQVFPLVPLDAAEESPAGQVVAGPVLEGGHAPDVRGLLVHAPRPEGQPAEPAFENAYAQVGITVENASA